MAMLKIIIIIKSRLEVSRSLGLYPCYNASFVALEIAIKATNLSGCTTQRLASF